MQCLKYTGLFKKNDLISLLRKSSRKLQQSHQCSTHTQLLFPVVQALNVSTTCSTDYTSVIREFHPDTYQLFNT